MPRILQTSVAVKELAEFVHRKGHINFRLSESTRSDEGIICQKIYQQNVSNDLGSYEKEVSLSGIYSDGDNELKISGRLDGCNVIDESTVLVEEIKTTRNEPSTVFELLGRVHLAQAKLYAGLMANEKPFSKYRIRLTYLHPDTLNTKCYDETYTKENILEFWHLSCSDYMGWIKSLRIHKQNIGDELQSLRFPFADFRGDQRRVASHVYRSARDRRDLLLDAPTGSGKTIATIFPAIKALGTGMIDRVIYSTARVTGQKAILAAIKIISSTLKVEPLICVTMTARERICFNPELSCDPDVCEFANGYYDRVKPAIIELLRSGVADQEQIERVARIYKVCPFHLGAHTARWADVIVCDYNHVFDPFAHYTNLINKQYPKAFLLLDEAHRLVDRTADSLSAELDQNLLRQALELDQSSGASAIKRIDRILETFSCDLLGSNGEMIVDSIPPYFLKSLNEVIVEVSGTQNFSNTGIVFQCWSMLYRFLYIYSLFRDNDYVLLLRHENQTKYLQIRCLRPAYYIRRLLDNYHGSVRFSGTLAPTELYQALHGCEGPSIRSRPDIPPDALGVFIVNDIPTTYRKRHLTVSRLALLLEELSKDCCLGKTNHGSNYLVAFPSYEYMQLVLDSKETWDCPICIQTPSMDLSARDKFIDHMNNEEFRGLGFAVTGGVFTESIDYGGSGLAGVIVVGPSLPPASLALDTLAERECGGWDTAYLRPAMSRVVQCAGRVMRDSNQKGVIVLIDPRFSNEKYQSYFPLHWEPKATTSQNLAILVSEFWAASSKMNI